MLKIRITSEIKLIIKIPFSYVLYIYYYNFICCLANCIYYSNLSYYQFINIFLFSHHSRISSTYHFGIKKRYIFKPQICHCCPLTLVLFSISKRVGENGHMKYLWTKYILFIYYEFSHSFIPTKLCLRILSYEES